MHLLNAAHLHYLWIRFLVSLRHARYARIPLITLGLARHYLRPRRRRQVTRRFATLAALARAAGRTGPLTTQSPSALARRHHIDRSILGAAPAMVTCAPPDFIASFVNATSFDALEAAAAERKGLVIVGTHFGSLGISPAVLAKKGHRVIVLRDQQFARLLHTPHAEQFFLGAEPIFLDTTNPDSVSRAILTCARALREGAIVAYTADAGHGTRVTTGKIFGKEASIRTALVELAMRTGSYVAPAFSYTSETGVTVDISAPSLLATPADFDHWCSNFFLQWESLLLSHPTAISWHHSDLHLVGDN